MHFQHPIQRAAPVTKEDLQHVLASLSKYDRVEPSQAPRQTTPGIIQTHVGTVSIQFHPKPGAGCNLSLNGKPSLVAALRAAIILSPWLIDSVTGGQPLRRARAEQAKDWYLPEPEWGTAAEVAHCGLVAAHAAAVMPSRPPQ